jgi:AraC-like DNA-binding protein
MWIVPDRVFYAGLLGNPSSRTLGAHAIYVGLDAPVEISVQEAAWTQSAWAVVGPYVPHRVRCEARQVGIILVEPESIMVDALPRWLLDEDPAPKSAWVDHLCTLRSQLSSSSGSVPPPAGFDPVIFGEALARRALDPRIQRVVDAVKQDPCNSTTGEAYATQVQLSLSRFVHLFKSEVGVPFRRFRSWRRARHLLLHATSDASLLAIAMATGYPDSTHFSHSIRQSFGLTPRDILAGSRRLLIRQPA